MNNLDPSVRSNAPLTREEVEQAAATLITAFGTTDTKTYFASFSPDADFIFHTESERLKDRASYEQLWQSWLSSGWRVTSCESTNARVELYGSAAVFSHDVRTTTESDGRSSTTFERETIVFARASDGGIVAVHEHLSADPSHSQGQS